MERYSYFARSSCPRYAIGSPVILMDSALVIDNENSKAFVQLNFKNISEKRIESLKVSLTAFDGFGSPVENGLEFTYSNIAAARDAEFGQNSAIFLSGIAARSFSVSVKEVVFADGSRTANEICFWRNVPAQIPLDQAIGKNFADQYRRELNMNSTSMPMSEGDLWFCQCGAINKNTEGVCHNCHIDMGTVFCTLNSELLQQHMDEYAKNNVLPVGHVSTEGKNRPVIPPQLRNNAKDKKVAIIAAVAAVVVLLLIITGVGKNGYAVKVNGNTIAYYQDAETFEKAIELAEKEIREADIEFDFSDFKTKKADIGKKKISDVYALRDEILANFAGVYSAHGLYIDGNFVGSTDEKDDWEAILEDYKESFRHETDPDSELFFEEDVTFTEGYYETSSRMPTSDFEKLLDEGKSGKKYHFAEEGETLSEIATMYGISHNEIIGMNPSLGETVGAGKKVVVRENMPYLTVLSDNEVSYQNALEYFRNDEYAKSISEFKRIEGYKDSEEKITEVENEQKYQEAVSYMDSGKYQKAIKIFKEIKGYKDSSDLLKKCQSKSGSVGGVTGYFNNPTYRG